MKTKTLKILKLIWKILKFILSVGETYISDDTTNENVVDKPKVLTLKKKTGDIK